MDYYDAVEKRRTVREFQPKPVEEEKLLRILAAGLKAPSHNHLREWEFILVKDFEQRRKVVELGAKSKDVNERRELKEATRDMKDSVQREMYLKALPVQKSMLLSSAELLIVCFRMIKTLKQCNKLYDLNSFATHPAKPNLSKEC